MNRQPITTTQHPTRNPKRSRTFTVNFFNTQITTLVTSTPAVARQWVYDLRRKHRNAFAKSSLVVGLGVQWTPTHRPDPKPASAPRPATLQLCLGSDCLIFQIQHAYSIPATLSRLLKDDGVTFVGVHNGRDARILEDIWPTWGKLEVKGLVDLARSEGFGRMSMEDICTQVLGLRGVAKPRAIGMSNWDVVRLSDDQVQYACVDAHVSYLLGVALGYPKAAYYVEDENDDEDGGYYVDDDGDNDGDGVSVRVYVDNVFPDVEDDDYTNHCFSGSYWDGSVESDWLHGWMTESDWLHSLRRVRAIGSIV